MTTHNCETCRFRATYDRAPASFVGRLWRWHIGWCPGWNGYINSLPEEKRAALDAAYGLKRKDKM